MTQASPELVIAAALRLEVRALRKGAPGTRVMRTGMGPARSRRAARRLREDPAGLLAVAGLCGAVDPSLRPGDVVVASELQRAGQPPLATESTGLCGALEQLGITAHVGAIRSVEKLVRGSERRRLCAEGCRAVDMESAWLAEAADGRPLAVLRIVLDAPGHELSARELPRNGWRALRRLRAAAPALALWAARHSPARSSSRAPVEECRNSVTNPGRSRRTASNP
jgi:4-hydroxy-3-methylbut-2-enyl diphosphate reductase